MVGSWNCGEIDRGDSRGRQLLPNVSLAAARDRLQSSGPFEYSAESLRGS